MSTKFCLWNLRKQNTMKTQAQMEEKYLNRSQANALLGYGLDLFASEHGPMQASCGHNNEALGSI